jgi:cytoskeleton protein RodZ
MSAASEVSPDFRPDVDDDAIPVVDTPVAEPTVGERLRAAREARGMDVDAVASALKLSRKQIEALEVGDWARLPGHTFIRGFVRNYARIVHLEPDSLLADLDAPPAPAPRLDLPQNATAVMPDPGHAKKRDYAAVLAGLVLIAVAVVAYYVVPSDLWLSKPAAVATPEPEAPAAAAAPIFPPGATPPANVVADGSAAPAEGSAAATAASASGAPAPAAVEPAAAPSTGQGLRFTFTQPSWVEVRDKTGQILLSQLNPAGSEREVDGQPPFSLVVGNAANVTVQYKGRTIELQPRSKDDVARVTVE